MLLNGMFAFRKTIVQIKRNPDTSTESIADQQPSTYGQHNIQLNQYYIYFPYPSARIIKSDQ